jgi:hypothetical protein
MRFQRFWRRNRIFLLAPCLATAFITLVGSGYLVRPSTSSLWSSSITARHHQAARNCNTARAVGLAPAKRGEPGYWPHLDADQDGIACEPWLPL